MLQINKNLNKNRVQIQIIGSNLEEVKCWAFFFYNRGAIEQLGDTDNWMPEEILDGNYLAEFSCDKKRLEKAYELSFKHPGGRKYRKLMKDSIQKQIKDYVNQRIDALGEL